jgi:UDP-glucose 4-epimerase
MNILVTGGAGYIGSHTCIELLNAGFDVQVLDNLSNSSEGSLRRVQEITGKRLGLVLADLRDQHKLRQILRDTTFDAAIHFAGLKAVGESPSCPWTTIKKRCGWDLESVPCHERSKQEIG